MSIRLLEMEVTLRSLMNSIRNKKPDTLLSTGDLLDGIMYHLPELSRSMKCLLYQFARRGGKHSGGICIA